MRVFPFTKVFLDKTESRRSLKVSWFTRNIAIIFLKFKVRREGHGLTVNWWKAVCSILSLKEKRSHKVDLFCKFTKADHGIWGPWICEKPLRNISPPKYIMYRSRRAHLSWILCHRLIQLRDSITPTLAKFIPSKQALSQSEFVHRVVLGNGANWSKKTRKAEQTTYHLWVVRWKRNFKESSQQVEENSQ